MRSSNHKVHKTPATKFIIRLITLFTIAFIIATAAILRDGKILGHDLRASESTKNEFPTGDTLSIAADGGYIVNTKHLAKEVQGYGGPVALRIHISKDGVVSSIEALPNAESPDFFERAKTLFTQWQGKSIDVALKEEVDGISGATFSSKAIIENMRRGLKYAHDTIDTIDTNDAMDKSSTTPTTKWTFGAIASILVALLGAILPLWLRGRLWHNLQLTLNVVVLGLWTGTFVSYALLLRLASGGIDLQSLATIATPLIMAIVALIYPLAGHSGHYCAHICPLGSAQELAGKLTRRKPRMSPRINKALTIFRNILWAALMTLMLTGTWTAWVDYELFTAFLYTSASIWVIASAILFVAISIWIPRPYCRFVCPTGFLIKL